MSLPDCTHFHQCHPSHPSPGEAGSAHTALSAPHLLTSHPRSKPCSQRPLGEGRAGSAVVNRKAPPQGPGRCYSSLQHSPYGGSCAPQLRWGSQDPAGAGACPTLRAVHSSRPVLAGGGSRWLDRAIPEPAASLHPLSHTSQPWHWLLMSTTEVSWPVWATSDRHEQRPETTSLLSPSKRWMDRRGIFHFLVE